MNLQEIKDAVLAGKTVCWASTAYEVIVDNRGQWFIRCNLNDNHIGLTWLDGTTMNGHPDQFFIKS
jgi:hypothetical protein